jgi:hypothetical protein
MLSWRWFRKKPVKHHRAAFPTVLGASRGGLEELTTNGQGAFGHLQTLPVGEPSAHLSAPSKKEKYYGPSGNAIVH